MRCKKGTRKCLPENVLKQIKIKVTTKKGVKKVQENVL